MTNVDFFRDFAESTAATVKTKEYYFEHDMELQVLGNLMQALDATDKQKKMFHFTLPKKVKPIQNKAGNTIGVQYGGEIMILVKADPKIPIDVQHKGPGKLDPAAGRYTTNVKSLIDEGEIARQIQEFATLQNITNLDNSLCDSVNITILPGSEVYGEMGFFGDGVNFEYDLIIMHDNND